MIRDFRGFKVFLEMLTVRNQIQNNLVVAWWGTLSVAWVSSFEALAPRQDFVS